MSNICTCVQIVICRAVVPLCTPSKAESKTIIHAQDTSFPNKLKQRSPKITMCTPTTRIPSSCSPPKNFGFQKILPNKMTYLPTQAAICMQQFCFFFRCDSISYHQPQGPVSGSVGQCVSHCAHLTTRIPNSSSPQRPSQKI